jgi:hypothetical protein
MRIPLTVAGVAAFASIWAPGALSSRATDVKIGQRVDEVAAQQRRACTQVTATEASAHDRAEWGACSCGCMAGYNFDLERRSPG